MLDKTSPNLTLIDRNEGLAIIKHFLPRKTRKLFKTGRKIFNLFFNERTKCLCFSPEINHFKKLRREVITTDVNKIMHKISKIFRGQPNITSHSFRVGYITQLWKDSKDIDIGHQKLDTISAYVNKLSDQERRERIS